MSEGSRNSIGLKQFIHVWSIDLEFKIVSGGKQWTPFQFEIKYRSLQFQHFPLGNGVAARSECTEMQEWQDEVMSQWVTG